MERFWHWLMASLPLPQTGSVSSSMLAILLVYSFSSQFRPIEPYIVPYLTTVKHFTNFQVTVEIFPYSVYAQLIFTLLLAPACFYLSYKPVIVLGAFASLVTYLIIWGGQSLSAMQIMQITYGFGTAASVVFSSYIFLLVPEHEYQTMTSLTTATSLLSFMLASELSQFLALEKASYTIFFTFSLISLIVCCAVTLVLPKGESSSTLYPSLNVFWCHNEGWLRIFKETWDGKNIQILSLWWALAYAGFSLVQNYGTTLFDAIDSNSNLNGHIVAASQAAGGLGSLCALYLENFAIKSGMFVYVLGSAIMAIICACMGFSRRIWIAYLMYVIIYGTYQTLACLVSARCGRLLSNRQFILLFSVNNFAGLFIETLLQVTFEALGLSVFVQFICFAGLFFLMTAIFSAVCFIANSASVASECEPELLIAESM